MRLKRPFIALALAALFGATPETLDHARMAKVVSAAHAVTQTF